MGVSFYVTTKDTKDAKGIAWLWVFFVPFVSLVVKIYDHS